MRWISTHVYMYIWTGRYSRSWPIVSRKDTRLRLCFLHRRDFVHGKTGRPINIKGYVRLTTHNRHINLLHYFASTIFSLVFASCSSLLSTSLRQRAQGPKGGQADLGQPIAAVLPDGSLPGAWGVGFQELSLACLAYRALDETPLATCLAHRARRRGHT